MSSNRQPIWVGVDGCRAGWFAVALDRTGDFELQLHPSAAELWRRWRSAAGILIDMPIGLPSTARRKRSCDVEARRALGRPRSSSVFSPPCREALSEVSYRAGSERNRQVVGRGLSRQSWALCKKIREVDELLRHDGAAREAIREVHPEVCLWALNGFSAMTHNKKRREGFAERLAVLSRMLPNATDIVEQGLGAFRRSDVARDDLVDALAAAVTGLVGVGRFRSFPEHPEFDEEGLRQEMLYGSHP